MTTDTPCSSNSARCTWFASSNTARSSASHAIGSPGIAVAPVSATGMTGLPGNNSAAAAVAALVSVPTTPTSNWCGSTGMSGASIAPPPAPAISHRGDRTTPAASHGTTVFIAPAPGATDTATVPSARNTTGAGGFAPVVRRTGMYFPGR